MNFEDLLLIKENVLSKKTFIEVKAHPLEVRRVLRNCDVIDPLDIEDYIARDGYQGAFKAIYDCSPQEVIDITKASGLRGRGGGGFPTGLKWQFAHDAVGERKFMICNADEGDPGAFMDRSVLEKDPHAVIEGMIIGGYAIGAKHGFIYVRAEYPIAAKYMEIAIEKAREKGILGQSVLGSDYAFDLEIRLGAGAFVCGEETALIASIEGKRGMPRLKPPFPAHKGLFDMPTVINNVETLANIGNILRLGADWFKAYGTDKSPGTKVFALAGKVKHGGLIEVPMGITLGEVIMEIGGGVAKNKTFKAVLTGGPSGGCLTQQHLEEKIDFDQLVKLGSMMGSGGMIVLDNDDCMVDIAKFYMDFMVDESCGKCTPCRNGTKQLHGILDKISQGEGTREDLVRLKNLAFTVKNTALCGLGKTAPNPILSTLMYFEDEYLEHVDDKHCKSGACKAISRYFITDTCIGCSICAKVCPETCISKDQSGQFHINQEDCIICGACIKSCPVNAIEVRL